MVQSVPIALNDSTPLLTRSGSHTTIRITATHPRATSQGATPALRHHHLINPLPAAQAVDIVHQLDHINPSRTAIKVDNTINRTLKANNISHSHSVQEHQGNKAYQVSKPSISTTTCRNRTSLHTIRTKLPSSTVLLLVIQTGLSTSQANRKTSQLRHSQDMDRARMVPARQHHMEGMANISITNTAAADIRASNTKANTTEANTTSRRLRPEVLRVVDLHKVGMAVRAMQAARRKALMEDKDRHRVNMEVDKIIRHHLDTEREKRRRFNH